jgi:hypothetical protein
MKFLRHLLGITKLHKEKNQCIREKTGAENIVKEIKQYQKKWLQHIQRMGTNRIPKQALQYKPKGRRNTGRPRKRWRDQFILVIKEQETCLILHEHDMMMMMMMMIMIMMMMTFEYLPFRKLCEVGDPWMKRAPLYCNTCKNT